MSNGSPGSVSIVQIMAECLPGEDGRNLELLASPPPSRSTSVLTLASSKDEEIQESLRRLRSQGKYVKLNVGGSLHSTTIGTLTKDDNMLRAMFSGRIPPQTDEEGWLCVVLEFNM